MKIEIKKGETKFTTNCVKVTTTHTERNSKLYEETIVEDENGSTHVFKDITYSITIGELRQPPATEGGAGEPSEFKKAPVGLRPRYFHDIDRLQEIKQAIMRFTEDGETEIYIHWIEEYNEIIRRIKACGTKGLLGENYGRNKP